MRSMDLKFLSLETRWYEGLGILVGIMVSKMKLNLKIDINQIKIKASLYIYY